MAAANAAGMSFEDHIIVGPKGWYSFYDEGLLTRAEALGLRAIDSGRPRSPDVQDSPQKARPPGRKRRDDPPSLLFLPGNPSHWFASTARGVRYISLCGVDRQNKRYRPKRGRRVAQCPLCQGAGTSPIPGSLVRRETVNRTQVHASRKVTPARRRLVSSDIARPRPLAGPLRAMDQR